MSTNKPEPLKRTEFRVQSGNGYHRVYQCTRGESGTNHLVTGVTSRKLADEICGALNRAYTDGLAHGVDGARALAEYVHHGEYTFEEITVDAVETGNPFGTVDLSDPIRSRFA